MLRGRKDKAFYLSVAEKLRKIQPVLGIIMAMTVKTSMKKFKEKLKISRKGVYTSFHFHYS